MVKFGTGSWSLPSKLGWPQKNIFFPGCDAEALWVRFRSARTTTIENKLKILDDEFSLINILKQLFHSINILKQLFYSINILKRLYYSINILKRLYYSINIFYHCQKLQIKKACPLCEERTYGQKRYWRA